MPATVSTLPLPRGPRPKSAQADDVGNCASGEPHFAPVIRWNGNGTPIGRFQSGKWLWKTDRQAAQSCSIATGAKSDNRKKVSACYADQIIGTLH